ncbi:hypothetical protein [Vibrio maritimus]|uniref:hypothetical protein n=1 Tax=Vibrio maritimus TaxID=990268 RepID=UPI003735887B
MSNHQTSINSIARTNNDHTVQPTIKDLANTPVKKLALATFVVANIGVVAAPASVAAIGGSLGWSASEIASYSGMAFITTEVLILGSALLLGKPMVALVKSKMKKIFSK